MHVMFLTFLYYNRIFILYFAANTDGGRSSEKMNWGMFQDAEIEEKMKGSILSFAV